MTPVFFLPICPHLRPKYLEKQVVRPLGQHTDKQEGRKEKPEPSEHSLGWVSGVRCWVGVQALEMCSRHLPVCQLGPRLLNTKNKHELSTLSHTERFHTHFMPSYTQSLLNSGPALWSPIEVPEPRAPGQMQCAHGEFQGWEKNLRCMALRGSRQAQDQRGVFLSAVSQGIPTRARR